MRVVAPSARRSVTPLRRTPVSKSLLCAYLRVLPRLWRIISSQLRYGLSSVPACWSDDLLLRCTKKEARTWSAICQSGRTDHLEWSCGALRSTPVRDGAHWYCHCVGFVNLKPHANAAL
jgi:hypothetical protein